MNNDEATAGMGMDMDFDIDNIKKVGKKEQATILRKKSNSDASLENIDLKKDTIVEMDIDDLIDNPYQPRLSYDEDKLMELALSIKKAGLLQPIVFTINELGENVIVLGHRRVRASRKAKVKKIRAIYTDKNGARELRTNALIENLQKEDMHPIDTALSFQASLDNGDYETQSELAIAVSKDRSYVSKSLKILTMSKDVVDDLIDFKSVNDKVILDFIRRIGDAKDCSEVYFWCKEKKPSRSEVKARIESLTNNGTNNAPQYSIKKTVKGYTIKLPKLTEEKAKEVEAYIKTLF